MSHFTGGAKNSKKNLSFDINLVPFLDLLSVCIYFLLLTAVWVQIGAMNVKQASGPQTDKQDKNPSVMVQIEKDGSVQMVLKNAPKRISANMRRSFIKSKGGAIDIEAFSNAAGAVRALDPDVHMAIISGHAKVVYDDLIKIMDRLREHGFVDLGVMPL